MMAVKQKRCWFEQIANQKSLNQKSNKNSGEHLQHAGQPQSK